MIRLAFEAYRTPASCSEIGSGKQQEVFSDGQILEYHAGGRRLTRG
jgi:hypothetical protein